MTSAQMQMAPSDIKVFSSVDSIGTNWPHCDARVFPDDLQWYALFEQYVLGESSDNIRVVQAQGAGEDVHVFLPLVRTRNKWTGLALSSMQNYYTVDYRPLCSTSAARALIASTLAHVIATDSPDSIQLQPLDSDAPETTLIRQGLELLGWPVYMEVCMVNWVHNFTGSYTDYIRSRPGKLRSTLKRRGAKLMALDGVTIGVHDGVNNLEALIKAYLVIYAKSWKVAEPHDQFIPALITMLAKKGQLRLGLLSIGERPVAAHFWIVKQGCAYIYKLAHDGEYDAYSPGSVLMAEMVKYVMEVDHVTRLDFMSGDDAYKQDWMSERREKLSLVAYNLHSLRGRLAHTMDRQIKPFVKRITGRSSAGKLSAETADRPSTLRTFDKCSLHPHTEPYTDVNA